MPADHGTRNQWGNELPRNDRACVFEEQKKKTKKTTSQKRTGREKQALGQQWESNKIRQARQCLFGLGSQQRRKGRAAVIETDFVLQDYLESI
jgi:hypothetical protein